jgi:hypothetical protein
MGDFDEGISAFWESFATHGKRLTHTIESIVTYQIVSIFLARAICLSRE